MRGGEDGKGLLVYPGRSMSGAECYGASAQSGRDGADSGGVVYLLCTEGEAL